MCSQQLWKAIVRAACPKCENTDYLHEIRHEETEVSEGFHIDCGKCHHTWFVAMEDAEKMKEALE